MDGERGGGGGGGGDFKIDYDTAGDSMYYSTSSRDNSNVFNIAGGDVQTLRDLPLVTVEIGKVITTELNAEHY